MDEEEPTPLSVLLRAMRLRWDEGQVDAAVALAKAAAPYVHAKPLGGRAASALSLVEDDKLDEFCRPRDEGAAAATRDTGEP